MPHSITLIPGDGIGPEVAESCVQVVAALNVHVDWDEQPAGLCALAAGHDDALPASTVASAKKNGITLKGPTATPIGEGHVSANVRLRRELDLYASVRPVRSLEGVPTRFSDVDLVIFRENTEGLYAGIENELTKDVIISIKMVTRAASMRIARSAFLYARKKGRKRVTAVHKANILKKGDGLFLFCARKVAEDFPEIELDDAIIDACCMRLVSDPTQFDVLLMENLYGDIISDLAAGLVGGLGVVPGANLGDQAAVFEAVHGTAPDIAGQGKANPTALLKSTTLMLEHLGELTASERLETALDQVLAAGKVRTGDLGGTSSTVDFTAAVIDRLA